MKSIRIRGMAIEKGVNENYMEKKVILAIDDEPHIQELLEYNLAKAGFLVLRADTGERGLELLGSAQVDLVTII